MNLVISNVLQKPDLIFRVGGFFHDSRIVSEPTLESSTVSFGVQRYGYECPAPEEYRLLGLLRWRLYPWVPMRIVVTGVASLREVTNATNVGALSNEISLISLEDRSLVFWCNFNEYHLALSAESTLQLSDTGAPLATGVKVFGNTGLELEGIKDLLTEANL
jgi:hypothetical protein